MDPDYEDRVKLYDFVDNTDDVLIVNTKTKELIESRQKKDIEFLPITIWDHNRKPCSQDYCIVNCLGSQPIIDMENSEYDFDPMAPDEIDEIDNLVTDISAIESESHLFRAAKKTDLLFISDELKTLFEKESIQGYKVFEAEGWDGLPV